MPTWATSAVKCWWRVEIISARPVPRNSIKRRQICRMGGVFLRGFAHRTTYQSHHVFRVRVESRRLEAWHAPSSRQSNKESMHTAKEPCGERRKREKSGWRLAEQLEYFNPAIFFIALCKTNANIKACFRLAVARAKFPLKNFELCDNRKGFLRRGRENSAVCLRFSRLTCGSDLWWMSKGVELEMRW